MGPIPPQYPSSAPRLTVGSPTNVWLALSGETPCNHGLPVNESLIGSTHEETVGINTGWGLKVTMERKLQNKTETITARFHSLYRCLQEAGVQKRVWAYITQQDIRLGLRLSCAAKFGELTDAVFHLPHLHTAAISHDWVRSPGRSCHLSI